MFWKDKTINKTLARLRKKGDKTQTNKIKNEREDIDTTNIQKMLRDYYEPKNVSKNWIT